MALGDVLPLDHVWYVTHSGLLRLARRKRCVGIEGAAIAELCDRASDRYAFKATVFTSRTCKGFVGYGDADPSNVSPLVRGAEMRVAETRAVNRASAKSLRHWHLLGRGDWFLYRTIGNCPIVREATSTSLQMEMAMAAPKSATACARSFASTSSTPPW